MDAAGVRYRETQIINDRGVAICKSMLSWLKFGEGKTPESEGIKSDHFVGDWYVLFEQKSKEEYEQWQQTDDARKLYNGRKRRNNPKRSFSKTLKTSGSTTTPHSVPRCAKCCSNGKIMTLKR
jgi:arginyl-tRNA synthetase